MKETAVAQRYSRALFLAVQENKAVAFESVQRDLKAFAGLVNSDSVLSSALNHAFLAPEKKFAALRAALERAKLSFSPLVINFFELLLQKKRTGLLPLIISEFDRIVDGSKGVIKVFVKSASALDDKDRREMTDVLSALFRKKIEITGAVEPDLLAGMVIKAGDTVIDNSLKSQLLNLKSRLTNGN